MKKTHILPILILLIVAVLLSQPAVANEPHQVFLPALPVNNGGCTPPSGNLPRSIPMERDGSDMPPATWIYVSDPSITVEITSPCDPLSHIWISEFYQDATYPNGFWTGFLPIQRSRFQIMKYVIGRNRIWVSFTSTNHIPYSVESSTP